MCWMSDNEMHRGFLELPNGAPMLSGDIAAKVGRPNSSVLACLVEMERLSVFSRDDRGCIYSRRMARDTHISNVRREAAKARHETEKRAANGQFAGGFAPAKPEFAPPKPHANGMQKPAVTASVPVLVSKTHTLACADRFEEFIKPWPRVSNPDHAARCWISAVDSDAEASQAFAARDRYLASDEVSRGVVMDPAKWLRDQKSAKWGGKWPAAGARAPKNCNGERKALPPADPSKVGNYDPKFYLKGKE